MRIKSLFIGDSVTDCDRELFPPLGNGWVNKIAQSGKLSGEIINVGTSGHRLVDLDARWNRDVLDYSPDRLTINIGINDTWRRYDDNDPTSAEDFHKRYDDLLTRTTKALDVQLVLCEPFLLHVQPVMSTWREDLDPKIAAIHELAKKYQAILIPFDGMFTELADTQGATALAEDGIHPTEAGHEAMSRLWLSKVLSA